MVLLELAAPPGFTYAPLSRQPESGGNDEKQSSGRVMAGDSNAEEKQPSYKECSSEEREPLCPSFVKEVPVRCSFRDFCGFCGTGLLASVAYLDPGNLEADIQLGVASGMSLLWWTAVCCLIFGFTFQCISGRLGLVTGRDLAQHIGDRYPKSGRFLLWFLIEIAIVGADIQETIGSAIALFILSSGKLPLFAGCIIVSITAFLLLLLDGIGFRKVEILFALFIAVEAVSMAINFIQADIPSGEVAKGVFTPMLTRDTLPLAVASMGAIVMPYNIFFQSSIINARPRGADSDSKKSVLMHYLRLENFLVLLMAFVINLFVICVFAEGFYGVVGVGEVGLESAGEHLAERYGPMFQTVWAIGLLASGQVATIGLTHAGQLVMMGLLKMEVKAGPRMIATRLVALIPTVTLAVIFEASHTFDQVAQLLNIVQSMMLPFALIPVLHVTADESLMGHFVSHPSLTLFGASVAAAVCGINGYLMVDFLHQQLPDSAWMDFLFAIFMLSYYLLVLYFAVGPDNIPAAKVKIQRLWLASSSWLRKNRRSADFESMLEVH